MLANVALLDAKPAVVVCPSCKQRLMEVSDVQWAATKLEFTYECTGCGAEVSKTVEGTDEIAAFTSRASNLLRNLQIFTFNPDLIGKANSDLGGKTQQSHMVDNKTGHRTNTNRRLT
jgi:DNA-directed RNA polymerase subunit RPC12/RpoP